MHSHHSHSGDYVSHAVDSLESIVQLASQKGFTIFCLTEHMPRLNSQFLYPEELAKSYSPIELNEDFHNYLKHAKKLKEEYNGNGALKLLVGFEVEGIDDAHIDLANSIIKNDSAINMCVGSVHHVHSIPIDFDRETWVKARSFTKEGTTRALYRDYFQLQYKIITRIKPSVVGHFDLIRLFEDPEEIDVTTNKKIKDIVLKDDWPEVWTLIINNIQEINSYGGLIEVNSAAIRKGWKTPYPKKDIGTEILKLGGKFCLSDDSHGLKQIGLNFHKAWIYLRDDLKAEFIYHLDLDDNDKTIVVKESIDHLDKSTFWEQYH
ncbi:Polymerase/histidinol phosphatase-like protein [Scheffersomyces amazonensis]|uniref:Polymerase/histidinol phosphatase-like protein n=1 Tax=Scheffersomyces amazonensis TaxID=1078765 RepID=UPI00315D5C91